MFPKVKPNAEATNIKDCLVHYEIGSYQRAAYSMHTIVGSALKMEITYSHFHSKIHSKVHWLHL